MNSDTVATAYFSANLAFVAGYFCFAAWKKQADEAVIPAVFMLALLPLLPLIGLIIWRSK